jgi:shikimate kinase
MSAELTPDRHVVLLGPMGAGKTSVGTALAGLLGRTFVDNDVELSARTGDSAAGIAAEEGLDALHDLEAEELRAALRRRPGAVLAAAASVVDRPDARALLAGHVVVWLDAPPDVLDRRIAGSRHRPDLPAHGEGSAADLAERRRERFAAVADLRVDAGTGPPEDVAATVVARLTGAVGPAVPPSRPTPRPGEPA